MISKFIRYLKTLDTTGTCPGIRGRTVHIVPGTDPETDVHKAVSFRKMFDYDAILYYYNPGMPPIEELDRVTDLFNQEAVYTDCYCLYMDPQNPTNTNPQPPAPCIIVQSYSELLRMRRGWT